MTNKNMVPPEEFINKWITTSALLDDPRAMIAAVWKAGAQSQHARNTADLVENFASSQTALMRKIERVRRVLRNTIDKNWVATPPDYKWVHGNEGFIITGIRRNIGTPYSQRWLEIGDKIAAGEASFKSTDFIYLRGVGRYNSGLSVTFPAAWFSMSDGDLAKMVRVKIRDAAIAQECANRDALAKRKASLEKELAKLTAQIESQG